MVTLFGCVGVMTQYDVEWLMLRPNGLSRAILKLILSNTYWSLKKNATSKIMVESFRRIGWPDRIAKQTIIDIIA